MPLRDQGKLIIDRQSQPSNIKIPKIQQGRYQS